MELFATNISLRRAIYCGVVSSGNATDTFQILQPFFGTSWITTCCWAFDYRLCAPLCKLRFKVIASARTKPWIEYPSPLALLWVHHSLCTCTNVRSFAVCNWLATAAKRPGQCRSFDRFWLIRMTFAFAGKLFLGSLHVATVACVFDVG